MISFKNVFLGEWIKVKHTYILCFVLVFPLLVTGLVVLFVAFGDKFFTGFNPWRTLGIFLTQIFCFLYPLMAIICAYLICHIEYKTNSIIIMALLPVARLDYFISKFIVLVYFLTISYIFLALCYFLSGTLLNFYYPLMSFSDYSIPQTAFAFWIKSYLGCICILTVHYSFCMNFDSFLVSMGGGTLFVVLGVMVSSFEEIRLFFPYSYSYVFYNEFRTNLHTNVLSKEIIWCLILSVFFLSIGSLLFKKKNFYR